MHCDEHGKFTDFTRLKLAIENSLREDIRKLRESIDSESINFAELRSTIERLNTIAAEIPNNTELESAVVLLNEASAKVEEAAARAEAAAASAETANGNINDTVAGLHHNINVLADMITNLHMGLSDISAKAASHLLYASDAPMNVTLYGKTFQHGSGDPSPDNVRAISGVDEDAAIAGGGNVLCLGDLHSPSYSQYCVIQDNGTIELNKTKDTAQLVVIQLKHPVKVGSGMKFVVEKNTVSTLNVTAYTKESGAIQDRKIVNDGLYSYDLSAYEGQTIDRVGAYMHAVYHYENATIRYMLRYDDKTEYEPFNASVIDMTAALNGEALYGNGTVDDIIENDVLVDSERKCRITKCWDSMMIDGNAVFYDYNGHLWGEYVYFRFAQGKVKTKAAKKPLSDRLVGFSYITNGWEFVGTHPTADGYLYFSLKASRLGLDSVADVNAVIAAAKAYLTVNPIQVVYQLATPEIYFTDPIELRKPSGMMPVTVTGSGETEVAYMHDTKHYIDSKVSELVTLALSNQ